ncbi:hypothetical protein [Limosilactobacillus equigenerosi]|uniref:SpoVT-AbrB domain-containing protein n=1 Tax=Limosilactobacillus equigenerosi DSM 18793 = JCM 14505 TaxID=1423742 RepID=A0A0R1ULA5_9LACO|nr:hypothetical protein [Limosilactobacillus equigenerosi]KRL93965.1 hypothetical protein FC21_GL001437 [Limosilactobacillus equigenerosi DSM 18793 = JCM 14505]
MVIKVKKIGESLALTIPESFKVASDADYNVEMLADGTIVYRPSHRNPFEGNWFKENIKQVDITEESGVLDSEWI